MLKIEALQVRYGAINALRGIALEVSAGDVVSIIGGNGAGKSTIMRAISGLIPVAGGRILFNGEDITRIPAHKRVAMGIAQSPEGRQIFADQTVRDNLMLGAWSRKLTGAVLDKEIDKAMEMFPRLKEREKQQAGTLSGGEQQMLAIARALMSRPHLLLLDEPSLGLAPLIMRDIFRIVLEIQASGITVLLVEQMASKALKISQHAYVLDTGQITLSGSGKSLLVNPKVREAYLGRKEGSS